MAEASALSIVLDISRARSLIFREAERSIASHGIGLNDLAMLLELHRSPNKKLTRIDLAERLGVTTSGVARQLHPLERIGLVGREAVAKDARMALVALTDAGQRTVEEVLPDAELRSAEVLSKWWNANDQNALRELLRALHRSA